MKRLLLIIVSVFLTLNSVSALSESEQINAANFIASKSYITNYSGTTNEYRINDNISRKEVMKIIINSYEWYKWDITWTYKCLWKYKDVANDWGCKYIEKSLNEWYIEKWEIFRPDDSITISETLKLIFKVKKIEKKYNTWDWQKDYINTAYDLWLIYDKNINWNIEAKRWFIFLTLANKYNYESYQWWELVTENKTDFYWIDFNLKIISSNKYELTWENISNDIDSIEILSCKENFSDVYDSGWYKLKSFKMWNSSFNYSIDKNFNNYCVIPYKVKLNYISGETKTIELNLNIQQFKIFTNKSLAVLWYPNNINLNTLSTLKNNRAKVIIDKYNLYLFNSPCYPEAYALYYKVNDYLSYRYIWNILIWDNYAHSVSWKKLFSVIQDSFVEFWTWYYKDQNNYYQEKSCYESYVIWNINKKLDTFSEKVYNYDWKYFYYDKEFEVWDKDTFIIVNNTWNIIENWLTLYSIFAKDKNNIYFQGGGYWSYYENNFKWDYDTFKTLQNKFNKNIWIDKYSIYYPLDNWGLKQYFYSFDLDSFKMEDDKLFSDKNWEYYLDEEKWIVNFDKESFKNIGDYIMYDKDKIYLLDNKININSGDFEIIEKTWPTMLRISDKFYYTYWISSNNLWNNNNNNDIMKKITKLSDFLNWKSDNAWPWTVLENIDISTFEKVSDWHYKDKNKTYDIVNEP